MGSDGLPPAVSELSVVLTDDLEMRALNKEYRGKDKTTDVLSFSQIEGKVDPHQTMLGDLVISVPTAVRQAAEYGVTVEEEILRLLIHGMLHLWGYDHEGVSPAEANRMRRKEAALYSKYLPECADFL